MALNWPTFFKRLGSAVVFAAIMMLGLLWKDQLFVLLIAVIMTLCIREYFRLVNQITGIPAYHLLEYITQAVALGFLALYSFSVLPLLPGTPGFQFWPFLLFTPILLIMCGALAPGNRWPNGLIAISALAYIALPCILLTGLRHIDQIIPIALILLIWTNDTMAYLVGSFTGKTPFSKVSPKKTWEGTIGGALFTVALAAVWGYYSKKFAIADWMVLALCAAVAGTAGDLLESKLKRMAGVKDSGTMMPGHGGALDRFDSLLVATPFAFCYAWFFMS